ncbi:MAG: hypothetical protein ACLRWM_01725 [Streptococcus sp.]
MRPIDADKVIPAIYNKGLHLKYEQISDMSDAINSIPTLDLENLQKVDYHCYTDWYKSSFGNAIYVVEKLKVLRTLNLWGIVFAHIVD